MPAEPSSILILNAHDVLTILNEKEDEIVRIVKAAYLEHAAGASFLPPSTFLRFPNDEVNRIVALPAYLGGDFDISGIKWISSFPGNRALGMDRASAVIIVNSTRTGRPQAILEGAIISAKRTAASAALAAAYLHHDKQTRTVGIIGCGLINFDIVRFLRATFPQICNLVIFDNQLDQAQRFSKRCRKSSDDLEVEIAGDYRQVLRNSSLISVATTAVKPHLSDVSPYLPRTTILHVSLRDFSVCRANTSVHLAEQAVASRNFIRCTLANIINDKAPPRNSDSGLTIFSPFGLGILDLAVSKYVYDEACKHQLGMTIGSFFNLESGG
jgi:N-[(2S)-2-amino-2-carboxyethyl]-L-glutamate dehydrogenase